MASSVNRYLIMILLAGMISVPSAFGVSMKDYGPVEKLIGDGKCEEAAEKLRELVQEEPKGKIYWKALGFCLEKCWDFKGASEAYEKSLEAGDDSADTTGRLGICYQRMNKFEEAIGWYRKALSLELRLDGRIIVLAGLAECSDRLGREEDFAEYLEKLREVSGKRAGLVEARSLKRDGRKDEAEDILSRLNYKFQDDPLVSYELALMVIDNNKELFFAAKLLDSIKPNDEIRQLDIDLARLDLAMKRRDAVTIKTLKEKLEKAEGLTPDEETYRKELLDRIEKEF